MSPWDPTQYDRFKDERSRPFFDLLALVRPKKGMRVVDLGCGTGTLTRRLHEELGAKETLGIDASSEMLAAAAPHVAAGLRFERGDIATFELGEGRYDLVFSNAALQWVDDHHRLLPRLAAALAPRGQLAVQVPANHDHPSHVVAQEVAREPEFAAALGGWVRTAPLLSPEGYATALDALGFSALRARLEVYVHHLASRRDVVEWVKGTLLTAYEQRMPKELYARFLSRYEERLLPALEDTRPYVYPFNRILFWGERP